MAYSLRCPVCRVKMPWDPTAGFPEFCPNISCESRIAHDRDDSDVVMPFYRSAATKANDDLYRQMEKGSEFRAQAAAEQLGVPVSEMSDLKITNLNSTRYSNDVAAVPVNNDVTRAMANIKQMNPNAAVGFSGSEGIGYSSAVQTGPHPNIGAQMRTAIQNAHPQAVQQHCVGKDEQGRRVVPSTDVVSERPANETMQPGYRRRG